MASLTTAFPGGPGHGAPSPTGGLNLLPPETCAARLAKAGALIPWLAEELEANGWEGVKRRLIELLGDRDGKEVHLTLIEALKEIPFYPNKPLAVSLGIYEEYSKRRKEGSKNGKRYIDLGGMD